MRRQAAKTRRYKILREEFRELLRQTFSAEGKYLTELVDELETKFDEATKNERRIFRQVAEKDEAFRARRKRARSAEENLSEIRARHSENALQRDRNQREKQYQQQQIANLKCAFGSFERRNCRRLNSDSNFSKPKSNGLKKEEQKERAEAEKAELASARSRKKISGENYRITAKSKSNSKPNARELTAAHGGGRAFR